MAHWLIDLILIPIVTPFILLWILLARLLSLLSLVTIILPIILAKRLYWALPIALILRSKGILHKIGFEALYCINVTHRFLTLPLRRHTPTFYILGSSNCGASALLFAYLEHHPALHSCDDTTQSLFNKESHFFDGILGRGNACRSKTYYRSFFPTILTRWWRERVRRVGRFMCFDACLLTGFTAKRIAAINPSAKLIIMVRDPVDAVFSAEIMLRNMGIDLAWSLMEDVVVADPRFTQTADDIKFWQLMEELDVDDELPSDMPERMWTRCSSFLKCASYAERLQPFLHQFPRKNIMFVEYSEFVAFPDKTINQVLAFVGADLSKFTFKPLSIIPGSDRNGRRIHPAVRRKLESYFSDLNQQLFTIVGKEYPWNEVPAIDEEEGGGGNCGTGSGSGGSYKIMATTLPIIQGKLSQAIKLLPGSPLGNNSKQKNTQSLVKRTASSRRVEQH